MTGDCSSGGSVTLLVLLPAAARARVVAANLRLVAPHRLRRCIVAADAWGLLLLWLRARERARAGRLRTRATEDRRRLRRRIVEDERWRPSRGRTPGNRRLLVEDRPQPPQVADDFLVHTLLHCLEQREALFLVLDERIALTVAAE